MSRWFRVYDDLVDDPKVQRLSDSLFKALVNLWCLTSRNGGALPPLDDIAFSLRLKPMQAHRVIVELRNAGLLEDEMTDEGNVTRPHNWNGRQFKSDVSNERVKRHRQQRRNVTQTVTETPPETEAETETEISPPTEAPRDKPDDNLVREAVATWNAAATEIGWAQVQRVTGPRRAAVLARLAECGGITGWQAAIDKAKGSAFLCGDNAREWRMDFDFLCKPKNFTKLMEGSYDRSNRPNGARPGSADALLGAIARRAAPGLRNGGRQAGEAVLADAEGAGPDTDPYRDLEIPASLVRIAS